MHLNYQLFPSDQQLDQTPLLIIPGLFGSISNWRSVAKQLAESRPVFVIDQRNHGGSPHAPTHSYADMVEDIAQFCKTHELSKCHLAGHSMGGKVAMLFALQHAHVLDSLIVLDIAPVRYQHSHAPFLRTLIDLDLSDLGSRAQADKALREAIPDTATRLFLLQSLAGSPGNYRWRLNLPVLLDAMDEIMGFPDTELTSDVKTMVMRGELSTYLKPEHHARLADMFANIEFECVRDAGHWLHAEQPHSVIKYIEDFLQK